MIVAELLPLKVYFCKIMGDFRFSLQCDGCKLDFGIKDHLLHHVLTDHLLPNSRMLQCPWTGCSQWLSTADGSQVCIGKHTW